MHWSNKMILGRRSFLRALGLSASTILAGTIGNGVKALAQTNSGKNDAVHSEMPTLYIPHGGGPCFFMDWTAGPADTWNGMAFWLKQLASSLSLKPEAIIIISAHWEQPEIAINSVANPHLLYDYYGFPAHTYKLKYNVKGSPELAEKISDLLTQARIPCRFEKARGLDHGVFIPLKLIYPEANIPVVQVSLKQGLDSGEHIEIGRALAPLRKEGILIIGSGMSYHNFSEYGTEKGSQNSIVFDDWLKNSACHPDTQRRYQLLREWEKAPAAREAHPLEEHLLPLMIAAGAGLNNPGKRIYSESIGGIAISGFQFG